MGLDSVELVIEVENYFGISIPDPEAEKADTVQAMVDTVARHLNIIESRSELHDDIYKRINLALLKLELSDVEVSLTELISKYLSLDKKEVWGDFKNYLQLDVPVPEMTSRNGNKLIDKIKNVYKWTLLYDWLLITIDQFIAAICANNYEELIDRKNIKSTFEIYVAVIAITVDKIGVDYYDITPEKSFTLDLGVD